ncbi:MULTISPECIES: ABC transporter ATP-binding protein [unclassified Arthrobacter]|uniref:ABC transporter ATP-binding protein n=1 Tax=unclassified Arthrobacter TaxID=235627 RepID=UPI001EFFD6DC|nr:ATP-binding cassette domain-containing protein [Arthrobacter sp. FW306-06-A]UKA72831.1 ATP-binding cassette domain-containing protein [Arthrobacter sp. FW306-06-A]
MAERMATEGPRNAGKAGNDSSAGNDSAAAAPVLAAGIRHFTFHDGQAPALREVGVSFPPGSFTAVLGASGSGKSTLGRLLASWLPPGGHGVLSGFLELSGTRLEFDGGPGDPRINPAEWGRQVGFVPQDPATVLSTVRATVAEELAFGLENAGIERGAMVAAVERTAGLLGLRCKLDEDPARLSGGQLRRLAIGCAIIAGPPVLVMDEPLASLDAAGTAELAALVRDLLNRGTAVVILSQTIDPLLQGADTWLVLSDGTVTASGPPAAMESSPGSLPASIRRPGTVQAPASSLPRTLKVKRGAPSLQLQGVSFGYPAPPRGRRQRKVLRRKPSTPVLQDINLVVHPGEIVAVTGPNGAGKSTLLRHFNGLLRPTSGRVAVGGTDIAGTPVGRTAASVGLLFQQPRDQLFERTVHREVSFGLDRLVGPAAVKDRAAAALRAVGLAAAAEDHPAELPASAQRLLALATVLARKPAVLALDEPTVALDGDGLALLDAAVRSAAAGGAAVVLVTHDLAYARSAADRILALDGGRLVPA